MPKLVKSYSNYTLRKKRQLTSKETLPDSFDDVVSRAVAALDDFYPWVHGKYTRSILYLKGGDVNEEIVRTMSRWHLPKGSVSTWELFPWLTDEWFDGKMVIHIRK